MLPSIRERNEQFASLLPHQQRIAVAQDVISQLNLKELIAHSGVYADLRVDDVVGEPLGKEERCHVCALGALGVSVLNGSALGQGAYDLRSGLSSIFSDSSLVEIEGAFEMWYDYEYGGGEAYSQEDRLRMIMQNIVDNKGEFVGSDLPWYAPDGEPEEDDNA